MWNKTISSRQQIRDYVHFGSGKFTAKQVSEATGVDKRYVSRYLVELQKDGLIRMVCLDGTRGIYTKIKPQVVLTSDIEMKICRLSEKMTKSQVAKAMNFTNSKLCTFVQDMKRRGMHVKFVQELEPVTPEAEMYIQRVDEDREYSYQELCEIAQISTRQGMVAIMVRSGLLERIRKGRKVYFRKVNHA